MKSPHNVLQMYLKSSEMSEGNVLLILCVSYGKLVYFMRIIWQTGVFYAYHMANWCMSNNKKRYTKQNLSSIPPLFASLPLCGHWLHALTFADSGIMSTFTDHYVIALTDYVVKRSVGHIRGDQVRGSRVFTGRRGLSHNLSHVDHHGLTCM